MTTGSRPLGVTPEPSGAHRRDPRLTNVGTAARRYELFDGMLILRTTPMIEHQRIVGRLIGELQRSRHCYREVIPGPMAFQPANWRSLTPDIVVLPRHQPQKPPVLVAEVIDHSSRFLDRNVKPDLYAACGVAHYWLSTPWCRNSSRTAGSGIASLNW